MEHPDSMAVRLRRVCGRVRWRLKLQRSVRWGVIVGAATIGAAALVMLTVRLRWLETEVGRWAILGAAMATGLALVLGLLLRRVSVLEAAWRLDRAGELHDRLGSAVTFSDWPCARRP